MRVLTPKQYAEFTGMTVSNVYKLIRDNPDRIQGTIDRVGIRKIAIIPTREFCERYSVPA